jgi:hypothetical protein
MYSTFYYLFLGKMRSDDDDITMQSSHVGEMAFDNFLPSGEIICQDVESAEVAS